MITYNHKREFVGIDESDLRSLSFFSTEEFFNHTTDFANLFIREPGMIHNFATVNWLDYLTNGENNIEPKVLISAKEQKFTATLDIQRSFLRDSQDEEGFVVYLTNLKNSSGESISTSAFANYIPEDKKTVHNEIIAPVVKTDAPLDIMLDDEPLVKPAVSEQVERRVVDKPIEAPHIERRVVKPAPKPIAMDEKFATYEYDPVFASGELGLPVDLIEEFVQDFISQAKSFKEELYASLAANDMMNLRVQSHKLKGVAANLRIENALDALTIINASADLDQIKLNLDRLYAITAKLAGESLPEAEEIYEDDEIVVEDDDIYAFDIVADEPKLEVKSDVAEPVVSNHYSKKQVAVELGVDDATFNELYEEFVDEAKRSMQELLMSDENLSKKSMLKLKSMCENMRINLPQSSVEAILNGVGTAADVQQIEEILSQILNSGDGR